FWTENLDDTSARQTAPAQGDVQAQCPAGDALHICRGLFAQLHDRALAKLLLNLGQGILQLPFKRLVRHVLSLLYGIMVQFRFRRFGNGWRWADGHDNSLIVWTANETMLDSPESCVAQVYVCEYSKSGWRNKVSRC